MMKDLIQQFANYLQSMGLTQAEADEVQTIAFYSTMKTTLDQLSENDVKYFANLKGEQGWLEYFADADKLKEGAEHTMEHGKSLSQLFEENFKVFVDKYSQKLGAQ